MSSDSFGARSTLDVGGRSYEIFRLDSLADRFDVSRLPYSVKVLLENVLRLEDGTSVTAADVEAIAGWDAAAAAERRDPLPAGPGPDAGLHRRPRGRRPGGDARRDGRDRRRPGEDQPAGRRRPRHRPLGPGRRLRQRARLRRSTPSASSSATASATRSSSGAARPSTTSASCRRRPGSATRSTSSTSPRSSTAASATACCRPTPTPSSAPTRTRRWSTASACSAGGSAGSRPRRRCSASRSRCCCRRSSASSSSGELPEGATATDLVLTVTEMLRERGVVSKFVEFFGPGLADAGPRRPGDDRQHVAGVRLDLRDLPGRRRDPALPGADRPADRDARAGRRLRPRAGHVLRGGRRPTRSSPRCSSSTSATSPPASPARSGPRTGCRWPTPRRPSSRRWRSSTPRPGSRWATASTRRARVLPRLRPARRGPRRRARQAAPGDQRALRRRSRRGSARTRSRSRLEDGTSFELDHGRVVIAAITSCTNTSNPSVMVGAGLLARNAVDAASSASPG